MIVVDVELHPGGNCARRYRTASLVIWNDGTGNRSYGNYRFAVVAGRSPLRSAGWAARVGDGDDMGGQVVARGRVEGVPRDDPLNLNVVAAVLDTPTVSGLDFSS